MNFRAQAMIELFQDGWTMQEVGDEFGVTKQRVQQLVKRAGLTRGDGGITKRKIERDEQERALSEERCQRIHGCSREQLATLQALSPSGSGRDKTPIGAFAVQRCNARKRGIGWKLKIWDWWTIWQESGKWLERGYGADRYCMCRFGDIGPYEPGNVYIATNSQNSKDYYALHKDEHAIALAKRDANRSRVLQRKAITLPTVRGLSET